MGVSRYKVLLIGRPNVGKSSLFNVLLKKRKALISSIEGTTRDPVRGIFSLNENIEIELFDGAGVGLQVNHLFAKESIEKSIDLLLDIDLVLMVLDKSLVQSDDIYLIDLLRRSYFDKTFIIINKVDQESETPELVGEFQFGFNDLFFISCAHRRGIDILKHAMVDFFEKQVTNKFFVQSSELHVHSTSISLMLMGKPNVGKSALFNLLLGKHRAIVADHPGTTRDNLEGEFRSSKYHIELVDTPGIRRKSKIVEGLEKDFVKKAFFGLRQTQIILLLVDGTNTITHQDKVLMDVILEEKKPFVIGINKWDLVKVKESEDFFRQQVVNQLDILKNIPVHFISVKENKGIQPLLDSIFQVYESSQKKLNVKEIDQFLQHLILEKPPFSKLGKLKIIYVAIRSHQPLEIQIFVNKLKIVNEAYRRFMVNQLLNHFQLVGISLVLNLKERTSRKVS